MSPVSPWVARFVGLVPAGSDVLDVAAGAGRHTRELRRRGHRVVAVDRDTTELRDLETDAEVEVLTADLEGAPWPLPGRTFDAVVVTNYLHRPLFPTLLAAVRPGGLLLYETYARGQEAFGRPTNPDFLLRPGELLEVVRDELTVIAFEDLVVPRPARVQRIAAIRGEVPGEPVPDA
jgi:SAM-dependent methyltransferase